MKIPPWEYKNEFQRKSINNSCNLTIVYGSRYQSIGLVSIIFFWEVSSPARQHVPSDYGLPTVGYSIGQIGTRIK